MKTTYAVPEMSCGHCVAAIEKAVQSLDGSATVRCDLATKTVTVESAASQEDVLAKLAAEGYPVTPQA
ncbi:MAG: heavy-metal-associated domain-containing protein [Paracoccaceae bacterium]|jgi:copper chaperone|nr:heavy-metal-associated domain-containing protein [Paracoccaceae bacterium]